jgi:tellurite methyltransferase
MNSNIQKQLGQTDIYIIDQILKGRYKAGDHMLDAGCGIGRNLHWFLEQGFHISGIDLNNDVIQELKKQYSHLPAANFSVSSIADTPFADQQFDHIICSAVLHFADNKTQFYSMLNELLRILKKGGSLFIRIASDIGIEDKVELIGDGVYKIPDGSTRFLLTRDLLAELLIQKNITLLEPVKTTNVNDIRCMTTLLIKKL